MPVDTDRIPKGDASDTTASHGAVMDIAKNTHHRAGCALVVAAGLLLAGCAAPDMTRDRGDSSVDLSGSGGVYRDLAERRAELEAPAVAAYRDLAERRAGLDACATPTPAPEITGPSAIRDYPDQVERRMRITGH
ncbi:hypothetical protein WJX64_03065 [Leifsonia sp. YIM 134122]|uniref:Uncharacterized protein n=1 Tax=Leifsonia stereocauli TaxID=3134136 RepID=A0ABU9W0I6_9MICO